MSVWTDPNGLRATVVGYAISKTYTLATETATLFNVSGLVLVTGIVGKVTTAMTVANTVKLQANPTTGTSSDLCAATDLGTTDTPAGDLITLSGEPTAAPRVGIGAVQVGGTAKVGTDFLGGGGQWYIAAGTIQQVTTGTGPDGVIVWTVTYVPIETDAAVTAA